MRDSEFLLASAVIPACLSALYPRPESERAWLSTPPPNTMQPILKPPLVYALLIKGAAKSPTKPSPSPHTHKHHKPSKIAGTAQTGGAPWERGVIGSGVIQLQKRRKKKKKTERGKKHLRKLSLWIPLAAWVAVVLLHSRAPALPPSLPPSHSGNYDIYYKGEGSTGEEIGRGALG